MSGSRMSCKASWLKPLLLLPLCVAPVFGQKDLVKWQLILDPATAAPGAAVLGRLEARIDPGWHMYSLTPVKGANVPTTIKLAGTPAIAEYKVFQPEPKRAQDPSFNKVLETYEGSAVFLVKLHLKQDAAPGKAEITLKPRYQVCDATHCIPPVTKTVAALLAIDSAAPAPTASIPPGYAEPAAAPVETSSAAT